MESKFLQRYPKAKRSLLSSNAFFTAPHALKPRPLSPAIRIGLLGNLCKEKGLLIFLDLLKRCIAEGLPIIGVLAGPPVSETDAKTVSAARIELGTHLRYLGALFGEDIHLFYRNVDVLVFPTTFINEAQPNVVFEAMSQNVAIVAFGRGCLQEDVLPECGALICTDEDFVEVAIAKLGHWCVHREDLVAAQKASGNRLSELHNRSIPKYRNLLATIVSQATQAEPAK
jgi:glycosyltransferase involved in cell wall biosynthesis